MVLNDDSKVELRLLGAWVCPGQHVNIRGMTEVEKEEHGGGS